MDIQTRKLNLIQELLHVANSSIIDKIEKILQQERQKSFEQDISVMTMAQYEQRIDKAIDDLKNKKVKTAEKLKEEIESWK